MVYDLTSLLIQLLSGLSRAMMLFLLASGLSLIFGVMNILNFALYYHNLIDFPLYKKAFYCSHYGLYPYFHLVGGSILGSEVIDYVTQNSLELKWVMDRHCCSFAQVFS